MDAFGGGFGAAFGAAFSFGGIAAVAATGAQAGGIYWASGLPQPKEKKRKRRKVEDLPPYLGTPIEYPKSLPFVYAPEVIAPPVPRALHEPQRIVAVQVEEPDEFEEVVELLFALEAAEVLH